MTTIARLSIWLHGNDRAVFADAFARRLLPLVKRYSLETAALPESKPVAGVFSQFFLQESPAAVLETRQALLNDPMWKQTLRSMGIESDDAATGRDWRFEVWQTPAIPEQVVHIGPGTRDGLWHSFSSSDGLATPSAIFAIHQDQRGRLWFGDRYLICFDGIQLQHYSPNPNTTASKQGPLQLMLAPASDDKLWVGDNGVCYCDGTTFRYYTAADGMDDERVLCLREDRRGRLWVGTPTGLLRCEAGVWSPIPLPTVQRSAPITCLDDDGQGGMWMGSMGHVYHFSEERFSAFSRAEGVPETTVESILQDRAGRVWLGTLQGLYSGRLYSGHSEPHRAPATTFALCDFASDKKQTTHLREDAKGQIWCVRVPDGLGYWDGNHYATLGVQEGLASSMINTLMQDDDENIWVGSRNGISRWEGAHSTHFTTRDGLAHDGVMDICKDRRGRLFFATWGGLCYYEDGRWSSLPELEGQPLWFVVEDGEGVLWCGGPNTEALYRIEDGHVESIALQFSLKGASYARVDQRGQAWFISVPWGHISKEIADNNDAFVSCYRGRQARHFTADHFTDHKLIGLGEDRDGHMYFGGIEGIARFDGEHFTRYGTNDGLRGHSFWVAATRRKGGMWFLGWDKHWILYRFDSEQFTAFVPPVAEHWVTEGQVLCEDSRGHVWFATFQELVRFDGEHFEVFTAADGICLGGMYASLEDNNGHMWFATLNGITRYDGRVFQTLTRHNGLGHDMVQKMFQDDDGSVWIATEGGITRYQPRHTAPSVRLLGAIANQRYGAVERLEITAACKLVTFEFQGGSLTTQADRFVYVYRLVGRDDTWRTTREGRVEFRNLEPGSYAFEIQSVDRDFNYSPVLRIALEVEPDPLLAAWSESSTQGAGQSFIGGSEILKKVKNQLAEVAPTDLTVVILGETGTGKGLAARYLHQLGPRQHHPFVHINCGAIPEALIESELFGHERGAFTGAVGKRIGKVELAQEGTLFLDEIGDLPLEMQGRFLHLLQERIYTRIGSSREQQSSARVVAATNRDLAHMVEVGTFRADLFYRLQAYQVVLPPLRQRREDLPLLAQYFARRYARHLDRREPVFSPEAMTRLQHYSWPGNVREFEHLIQRAILSCQNDRINAEDILVGETPHALENPTQDPLPTLVEAEKELILRALEQTQGTVGGERGAAALLAINPHTLRSRMKKYGLGSPTKK